MANDDDQQTPPSPTQSPTETPNAQEISSESSSKSQPQSATSQTVTPTIPGDAQRTERAELLMKARSFLLLPQVQGQDVFSKRRFLTEKGLTEPEIEQMLKELPQYQPPVPPRTYPQPPPSNLPNLMIGLARVFMWLTGASAALVLVYYRYLLPLLTRSLHARESLKSHHLSLMRKYTTALSTLKESQKESFSVLHSPEPYKEDNKYAVCRSVDEVLAVSGRADKDAKEAEVNVSNVPPITLLRCAFEDCSKASEGVKPTTEDLFRLMEGKIPWLLSDNGAEYERTLWETLSDSPIFSYEENASTSPPTQTWTYTAPTPPPPTALFSSLTSLRAILPTSNSHTKSSSNPTQHTFQALADFTGYLTTQTYSLPTSTTFRPLGMNSLAAPNSPLSVEEEVRKEIRALKGLVLNRRSFMPATFPRSASVPGLRP